MSRLVGSSMLLVGLGLLGVAGWFLAREDVSDAGPLARDPPDAREALPEVRPRARPEAISTEAFRQREEAPTHEGLQVVDPEGRPVARALVGVFRPSWRHRSEEPLSAERWRRDAEAWRIADAQGLVALEELPPDAHLVCRHGRLGGWIAVAEALARRSSRLELRAPAVLAVRVHCGGVPQPGYRVFARALRLEGAGTPERMRTIGTRSALTDAEGVALIDLHPLDPETGRARCFRLRVEGFDAVEEGVDWNGSPRIEAAVEVPQAARIALRLVDGAGDPRPIDWPIIIDWVDSSVEDDPSARIPGGWELQDLVLAAEGRSWWRPHPSVVRMRPFAAMGLTPLRRVRQAGEPTPDGGEVEGWNASPAERRRLAVASGFVTGDAGISPAPWDPRGRHDPEGLWRSLPRAGEAVLDVPCDAPPIARLPLRLSDGTPLPRGAVTIREGDREDSVPVWDDGELRFAAVHPRRFRIAPADRSSQDFLPTEVEVPALERDGLLAPVNLRDLHVYTWGRVVDPAGAPVPRASVEVLGPGGTKTELSDADGRFRSKGRERPRGKLRVGARLGRWRHSPWHDVPAEEESPVLVIPETGGLRLSVRAPDAAPPLAILVRHHGGGAVEHAWAGPRTIPASGVIELGPLPVGLVDLRLVVAGAPEVVVPSVPVRLGELTRDPRLEGLVIEPHLEELEVEVLHPDGRPARGSFAILGALTPETGRALVSEQEVDAEGRVRFRVLPGARTVLVVEGLEGGQHVVHGPRHGQRVVLPVPCRVTVTSPVEVPVGTTLFLHAPADGIPEPLRETIVPTELVPGTAAAPREPVLLHPGVYRAELRTRTRTTDRRVPLGPLTVPALAEARLTLPDRRDGALSGR